MSFTRIGFSRPNNILTLLGAGKLKLKSWIHFTLLLFLDNEAVECIWLFFVVSLNRFILRSDQIVPFT